MGLCSSSYMDDDFEMPDQFDLMKTYPHNKDGWYERNRRREARRRAFENKAMEEFVYNT